MFKQEGQYRADYENYEIAHFITGDGYHLLKKVWLSLQDEREATSTYGRCYAYS